MDKFIVNRGLIVASMLMALFVWKVPLITQDGPNHKKVAVILSRLSESPLENAVYESKLGPLRSNSLFHLLYLSLSKKVSIHIYEKFFVGISLILILISFRLFLSVWSSERTSLWFFILPLLFHPIFTTGMYNFTASVSLTLFALTILRKGIVSRRWFYLVIFYVCCWAAFIAHQVSAIIIVSTLTIMAAYEFRRRIRDCIIYAIVPIYFLSVSFFIPSIQTLSSGVKTPLIFSSLPIALAGLFGFSFVSYSIIQLIAVVPFFVLLVILMFISLKSCHWKDKIFWVVFLALYLMFPRTAGGLSHLSERFLPFMWCFLPLGINLSIKNIKLVQWLSILTTIVIAISVFFGMKKVEKIAQDAKTVLQKLPSQTRLYPITFDDSGPSIIHATIMHIWSFYDDEKVVFSPYLFAHSSLMPLVKIHPVSETYFPATEELFPKKVAGGELCQPRTLQDTLDCNAVRNSAFQKIFQKASYYDYWFVYRPPQDFLVFIQSLSGVKKVAVAGDASLWHYEKAVSFDPSP